MLDSSLGLLGKASRKGVWEFRALTNRRYKVEILHQRENKEYSQIWPTAEFVHRVSGPVYVEPNQGWIITEDGVLLQDSILPQAYYKPMWRVGLPYLSLLRRIKDNPHHIADVNEIASLRHPWEYNYYHFHLDVLGKLNLMHQSGVPDTTPLALGRYAHLLPWPKQIISRASLAHYNYVLPDVDDLTIIRAESAYYCRTLQKYRVRMDYVLDLMDVPKPLQAGPAASDRLDGGRRIFLTRRPPSGRLLVNGADVENLVSKYGFEVVDTSGLGFTDQIRLFNETRYLIALHGAGLTNIIYRRGGALSVLELHAEGYITSDMLNLSAEYGYQHTRIAGRSDAGKGTQHTNFHTDISELEAAIRQMLNGG